MIALRALYNSPLADKLVFKGGTSLSKAWNIIQRFSEDIDLAIDRSFFGFEGELSKTKVKHLRKACCKFIDEEFCGILRNVLVSQGVEEFSLNVVEFEESDTDPLAIELHYKSLIEKQPYLKPRILIEISARSLIEPFEQRQLRSFISEVYPDAPFADSPVEVPTVLPTRTLLEKMFLLHEEFQKENIKEIRTERMTRHLYDISKLMDTPFLEAAINDKSLYKTIIEHRSKFTRISWVDYSKHQYSTLSFIPPAGVLAEYHKDYNAMEESMFYGETETFEALFEKIKSLNERMNQLG